MPLYGTLGSMPLPDLLQWLGTARRTGTLFIERNKVSKSILFEEGRLVGCSSDDPPEQLGHFLLARGKISEEQLRAALARQNESGKYLGMILVEMGGITPDELSAHLEAKAEETIFSLFEWQDGVFRFQEELTEQTNIFPVRLEVQDVLLNGLKRFDEMRRAREVFDDPGIVLRRTASTPRPGLLDERMSRTIFEAVNGDRTVAEIVLHVHGSEYAVTTVLFEMFEAGLVEILGVKRVQTLPYVRRGAGGTAGATPPSAAVPSVPSPAAAPPEQPLAAAAPTADPDPLAAWAPMLDTPPAAPARPAAPPTALAQPAPAVAPPLAPPVAATAVRVEQIREELNHVATRTVELEAVEDSAEFKLATQLEVARELMAGGELEEALDTLDELYQQFPGEDALRRLTAEAEAAFLEKAYKHYIRPSKIPVLAKPLAELEAERLSPSEFFLLSRMDGSWDVRSIVQIAPLREADALRAMKRMREAGLIDLRDPQ